MQPVVQRSIEDQSKGAAEQAGLGGLRWSTPLQRNITDIAGREMAGLGAQWTDRELQSREAGANRAMGAAGGLESLGQRYFQAPMDWSSQMYGMGSGMQGLQQQAQEREYQDWQQMQPWASPWTNLAMNYAGLQSQMVPQQYQQSPFSQFANVAGAGIPFIPGWGGS